MEALFCLSPRYRLDDELPWLEGIDPSRHYWVAVNGNINLTVAIPGLTVSSKSELKEVIGQFRCLQPGEQMTLTRIASDCQIHCISPNCYAVEDKINGAPVWHLFDLETLDSLLMTAHPDWQCAPSDVELGRKLLLRSFQSAAAAKS
ncbi:hypothetical protein H6G64_07115 [Calothrix sp. FACHB-156]|uniref:hypothetical protein n=1 Tax=Tolypothrix sp. PCC 7910 TaxID=2099387 RepID=UPI0014277FAB|nr:hypothetical protein [Tolypothrix sp. PCC 7910]MBD2215188.1 hypothetical protein [Nostoc linckia FACHB-104]MBD2336761.1 hypothetical protein [Calothrix sp. FACHB-156]QIR41473.1 hypothetical protein HCG51_17290 [Tolypothrix sp. PCC 7910]